VAASLPRPEVVAQTLPIKCRTEWRPLDQAGTSSLTLLSGGILWNFSPLQTKYALKAADDGRTH